MKNGGSAFPVVYESRDEVGKLCDYVKTGMTLRDYFAASALTGILAGQKLWTVTDGEITTEVKDVKSFALIAYIQADTMLAEREKQDGGKG